MLNTPDYKEKLRSAIEGKPSDEGRCEGENSSNDALSSAPSDSSSSNVSALKEAPTLAAATEKSEMAAGESKEQADSGERTDTGSLLQAGSIAAGVLGLGLMMAFGNGGSTDKKKKAEKK